MKRFLIPLVFLSILLIPAAASVGQSLFLEEITAEASGKQAVPPVLTDTSASFTLEFRKDLRLAFYTLTVVDGVDIVAAHLHCGAAGAAGPVVVSTFGGFDGEVAGGILRNGDIFEKTTADCGVAISNIASLLAAIRKDLIYVNVHSLANLPGEVRAQIFLP